MQCFEQNSSGYVRRRILRERHAFKRKIKNHLILWKKKHFARIQFPEFVATWNQKYCLLTRGVQLNSYQVDRHALKRKNGVSCT